VRERVQIWICEDVPNADEDQPEVYRRPPAEALVESRQADGHRRKYVETGNGLLRGISRRELEL
jgi:hypothetical protein